MKSQKLSIAFLSFFWTGFFPKAPGTVGSLATIPLIYLISLLNIQLSLFVLFIVALTIISGLVTDKVQKEQQVFDPGWIVIDEVIGMLITWIPFYPHFEFKQILIVFVLFRFFDIVKIWPASYVDKKIKSGFGTILDDVVSAIYAVIFIYTLIYFQVI